MSSYDENNIYLTLTHGIQNDVENCVYTDNIIADRKTMEVWKD